MRGRGRNLFETQERYKDSAKQAHTAELLENATVLLSVAVPWCVPAWIHETVGPATGVIWEFC